MSVKFTPLRKKQVEMPPFLRMHGENFAEHGSECCQITTISVTFRTRCRMTMYSNLVIKLQM